MIHATIYDNNCIIIIIMINYPQAIIMIIVSIDRSDIYLGGELFDRIVRKAHYNEKEARSRL